jgi:gamma-glutamyltranspeptidase/glutathione hydrolase
MITGEKASQDMYEYEDRLEAPSPRAHRMSDRFASPAVKGHANVHGYRSISTPGTVAGLSAAIERFGTFGLSDLIAPAADLAENGFPMPFSLTLAILGARKLLERFPTSSDLYLPGGYPVSPGQLLKLPEYARSLRLIAKEGPSAYYRGELAQMTVEDIQRNGGILTADDFASYEPLIYENGLNGEYKGHTLHGVPGANGCSLTIEALQILQHLDFTGHSRDSVEYLHLLIEAFKLANVDRFTYLGDPALTGSPVEALVHPDFAAERAEQLSRDKAGTPEAGDPWPYSLHERPEGFPAPAGVSFDAGTTHMTVVDKDRTAVALTQTNVGFSGVLIPGVGVMMNNAMRWPEMLPGTVNSIYPRARSVHNMSPLVIQKDGRLWGALGSSGGRRISTGVAQSLLNVIEFGMSLQEAVQAPRVHVETDQVLMDGRLGDETKTALERLGHTVHASTPDFISADFSTPNGVRTIGDDLVSGLYPANKFGGAAGH